MTANTDFHTIVDHTFETARRWASASTDYPADPAVKLLTGVLDGEDDLDYAMFFVDDVIRPEDRDVAAQHPGELGDKNPKFLPWYLRTPALIGRKAGRLLPGLAVPAARKVFARLADDLVVDVTDEKLGSAIRRPRTQGTRLNMNLLGEAVLGEKEARKRLDDTRRLLERPGVGYVSLKVSTVTGPHNPWGYEQVVDHAVSQFLPLYQYAAKTGGKFINLDMEEYRDLHITIDAFKKILDREECLGLRAGIVLQAYLPDTLSAIQDLQEWATARRARSRAPIKVRVVKGANLVMGRVDSQVRGWNLTTRESKQATDANYIHILDWAMHPERTANVQIGVTGRNLFTVAAAWELAKERAITSEVEIEMLSGMATQQAAAVRKEVGNLLLYVPVVHPEECDVAIAYLVCRLEENSAGENFMASIFEIGTNPATFERERSRFPAAVEQMNAEDESRVGPTRTQNRLSETPEDLAASLKGGEGAWTFTNIPGSDPTLSVNLFWAREIA